MSAPYEFSIDKTRMIQLVVCLVVIQVLFYGSGVATGLLMVGAKPVTNPETLAAGATKPVVQAAVLPGAQPEQKQSAPVAAAPKLALPEAPQQTQTAAASVAPAAAPVSPAVAPATPVPASNAETAAPAPLASSSTAGVAVQVASFHMKSSAVRLADVLKKQGYGPVVVGESGSDGAETWHFVQLGPYKEWDEASRIVAELDRSYAVHAYVRPIRNSVN